MSFHLVLSSESDNSDHDNDCTSLNLFHKLHKCRRSSSENQTNESRLNTSPENSTDSNDINVANVIVSNLPQKDNKNNCVDADGDVDDAQKNLRTNSQQESNNIIVRNHSTNQSTINAGKMLEEYFQ